MATSNMKDIKRRIKSIESTKQITKAMELVASSKLKKAKERALRIYPYFNSLYEVMSEIGSERDFKSIFVKQTDEKNTLVIVIAGDRGLAGGFNHNVTKLALERCQQGEKNGEEISVISIGKKAVDFFAKQPFDHIADYQNISEKMDLTVATQIAEKIVDGYKEGKYNRVIMFYTTLVSAMLQTAQEITLLPVDKIVSEQNIPATIYEPSAEAVFEGIVPKYLAGIIYGGIIDSFAAEQAARRNAMESATDNADDIIDNLSLLYNRARQAKITQELTEIASGSKDN